MTDIRTRILGLLQIGPGESPIKNDSEFFRGNMDVVDAAVGLVTLHRHNGQPVVGADAPDPPDVAVSTSVDGGIAGNATVHYRVSHVDASGNESPASYATSITTPAPLDVPDAPTVARHETGGDLAPGMYQYALSAYRGSTTLETKADNPATANLPPSAGDTQAVDLTLPVLPDDADGFNIYRRTPNATTYYFLASVPAVDTGDVFTDDGSISPNLARPLPQVDSSNAANAIVVTPDGTLSTGESWNVYRAITEDDDDPVWASSLVGQIDHPADELTDTGTATDTRSPIEASLGLNNPDQIDLGSEVSGVLPPANGGARTFPARAAGTWIGPAAVAGGTIEIAAGDVVFVPFILDTAQQVDALRVATSIAGGTDAKVLIYIVSASGTDGPGVIVASAELDVDVTPDDLVADLLADEDLAPGRWWLGIHNHTTGIDAATFHAYDPATQLAPIDLPAPSSTTGHSGLTATAGLTVLTNTVGLTFTPIDQAPVIQARIA